MKKKISVFALLLSLLLAVLVPAAAPVPVQAANATETTADDVKYKDIEDFMSSCGYADFVKKDGCVYFVSTHNNYLNVLEISVVNPDDIYAIYNDVNNAVYRGYIMSSVNISSAVKYVYYDFVLASQNDVYACLSADTYSMTQKVTYMGKSVTSLAFYPDFGADALTCLYSDFDIYDGNVFSSHNYTKNTDTLIFENSRIGEYSFPVWCSDAGLNSIASSNESPTKIPYSYNSYWHIVRKTSFGKWLLTTIGSTLGQSKINLRLSDSGDLIIYEFSGDDSFVISVRQYVYDTDGWKVRTFDTYDYDDFSSGLLTLPAGSGIDDTRVLAYTSTDIYSSDGLSVYAAASTEYSEPSVPDVTPEPTPGSGSSGSGDSDDTGSDDSGSSGSGSSGGGRPGTGTRPSVGGEASGGGGLDFVINLFTLIWTKICAVPMDVDGYCISLQQLFVYGALVSIVGGFIMKFIFRR